MNTIFSMERTSLAILKERERIRKIIEEEMRNCEFEWLESVKDFEYGEAEGWEIAGDVCERILDRIDEG